MFGGIAPFAGYWELVERFGVWYKGTPIPGYDPAEWRRDFEGFAMRWSDYGDQSSEYGWQIDHIVAKALGGGDDLPNLRPRHWRGNQSAGGILAGALRGMTPASESILAGALHGMTPSTGGIAGALQGMAPARQAGTGGIAPGTASSGALGLAAAASIFDSPAFGSLGIMARYIGESET